MRATGSPTRLSEQELAAMRSFMRAHGVVTRALDAELMAESAMSLAEYEVLLVLAQAPDRALRMTELAERALLSRSGLTRLVDRLVRDGSVVRQTCPSDARGVLAVLTPEGLARLRAAGPGHLRGVRAHLTDRLSPAELDELTRLLTVLGGERRDEHAGEACTA